MLFKPSIILIFTVFICLSYQEGEKRNDVRKANVQLSWNKNENSIVDSHMYDAIARQLAVPHNNNIKDGLNVQIDVFSPYKSNILFLFNGIHSSDIDLKIGENIPFTSSVLNSNDENTLEFDDDDYNLENRCFGYDFIQYEYKHFFPSKYAIKDITKSIYFRSTDEILSVIIQQFPELKDTLKMRGSLSSFYAEIASALRFASNLDQSRNENNDLYLAGFQSIGLLKSEFGEESVIYTNALTILKKTVDILLSKMKNVYNSKILTEAVFLPAIFNEHSEQCNKFKSMKTGYLHTRSVTIRDDNNTANNTNLTYGNYTIPEEIAEWHLFMWTWIGLAVIVFFAIYAMYTMDVGEDSLLYRTTNLSNKKQL